MGIICGFIADSQEQLDTKERIKTAFLKKYGDAYYYEDNYVFLGVLHSDITLQSIYENGPVIDKESNLVIIADAELDNRNELFDKLSIAKRDISDSELILRAYIRWENNCADHLLGEFAFVIYNRNNHKVLCVRDQLGTRKFYYIRKFNQLIFSTMMSALFPSSEAKLALNDLWIANFLSILCPDHEVISSQTVYKDIMQLEPAHFITWEGNSFGITKYWRVNIREKRNCSFEEACDGLRQILTTAIQDKIKTKHTVGISLSGGLDSGSVCVIANNLLQAENKQLYAYSSVPLSKYRLNNENYYIKDESDYIRSIIDNNSNIIHKFIDSDGKNSITDIEENLEYLEHPYKFIENFFWMKNIIESAKRDGCKVLLYGTFGNATISYGSFPVHIYTLLHEIRLFEAVKAIISFTEFNHVRKKQIIRNLIRSGMPDFYDKNQILKYLPVNKELFKKLNVQDLQRELKVGQYSKKNKNVYDIREFYLSANTLSQLNSLKSNTYLKYGIQIKDPTMDLRVIEYCFSIPYDYYYRDGKTRELIREAMKGLLPDKIRLNYNKRGLQSADWILRLEEHFDEIKKELIYLLNNDRLLYYLDVNKLKEIICNDDFNSFLNMDGNTVWMIIVSLIFMKFIKKYEES